MDESLFILGIVLVLILTIFGLLKKDVEWAVFPGMAIVIGVYLTLAVLADGSLVNGSGLTIASASTNGTSIWRMIEITPQVFTLGAFLIAVYRVGKAVS